MKRTIIALALIAVMIAACGPKAPETYGIAVTGALTGPSAQDGNEILNGATLAAEVVNAAGGVNGKMIEVIAEDDRSDPKEAANVANKLVNDPRVLAVIGHYNSSCTLAGAPIYNKAGLLETSAGSSSPLVAEAGPYTFRVIPTDSFQGDVVAKWMVEDLGLKKVAIFWENDDYGKGLRDVIAERVEFYGGEVVGDESYIFGETKDFSPLITKVRAAEPDALFLAGLYNEATLIAKQGKEVDWTPALFGVDAIYSALYTEMGGDAVEGTKLIGFFHTSNPDPKVQEFVKAFTEKYGVAPGTYAAYGYDAMMIYVEAIKNAGPDRAKMMEWMTTLKDYEGISGTTSFNEDGDVIKVPLYLEVKGGEFTIIE